MAAPAGYCYSHTCWCSTNKGKTLTLLGCSISAFFLKTYLTILLLHLSISETTPYLNPPLAPVSRTQHLGRAEYPPEQTQQLILHRHQVHLDQRGADTGFLLESLIPCLKPVVKPPLHYVPIQSAMVLSPQGKEVASAH